MVYNTGGTPSASPPAEANEIIDAEELKALRTMILHALELARGAERGSSVGGPELGTGERGGGWRRGLTLISRPEAILRIFGQAVDPKPGAPQLPWGEYTGREYDEIVKAAEAEFSPEVVRLLGLSKEQRPATQADVDAGRAARIGIQIDAALDERLARALHIVDRRLEQEPARVEAALQQQGTARVRASQIDARQAYDQELSRIDPTTPYAGRQDTTTAATQEDVNVGRALIVDERIPLSSLPPGDRRRVGAGEPKAPTPPPGLMLTLLHEKQQQLERDIAAGEIDSEGAFVLREAIGEAFKTLTYGRQLTEQDYAVLQEQQIDFAASGLPLPTAVSTAATAGQGSIRPFISADEESAVLATLVSAQLARYGDLRANARATAGLTAADTRAAEKAERDKEQFRQEYIGDKDTPAFRHTEVNVNTVTREQWDATKESVVIKAAKDALAAGSNADIAAAQAVIAGIQAKQMKEADEWAQEQGINPEVYALRLIQAQVLNEEIDLDWAKRTFEKRVEKTEAESDTAVATAISAGVEADIAVDTKDVSIQRIKDAGILDAITAADAPAALEREKEAHEANIGLSGVRTELGQVDLGTARGEAHRAAVARARGPQATYRQNQGDLMRRDFETEVQRHINNASFSQVELIPDQIVGEFLTAANTQVTPATRQAMIALATRLVGTGLIPLAPTTTPTPPTPRPAPTQQPVVSTPAAAAAALDGLPSYIRPEGAFVPAEF